MSAAWYVNRPGHGETENAEVFWTFEEALLAFLQAQKEEEWAELHWSS
jgi:hypothetical protein